MSAVPVRLLVVGERAAVPVVSASGTVRLRRETPLAFLADGRVLAVRAREGDVVTAGQMLAALDRTAIDSAASAADARLAQARADLARQRQLKRDGWATAARLDQAEAAARAAEADRSAAQFRQRHSVILAPTGGVVLARLAEPGQTVEAGTPILVIGEFASGFVLQVPLAARDIAGLAVGDPATVRFRDGAAPAMAGRIVEIAGRADPRTGSFRVEVALPANPSLRSGLIADMALAPARATAGLQVPATALFSARGGEGFVWVFDSANGRVKARMVTLGSVGADGVEVVGGLARGEQIVAAGVDRLVEGQIVSVAAAPAPASRAPA